MSGLGRFTYAATIMFEGSVTEAVTNGGPAVTGDEVLLPFAFCEEDPERFDVESGTVRG